MDIAFTYPCFYRYQCSDYQNIYVWWKYLNIANEKMALVCVQFLIAGKHQCCFVL